MEGMDRSTSQAMGKSTHLRLLPSPDRRAREADESTVIAFREGDQVAANALHDRFASRVFSLGLRVLKNRTEAEDLVQDTFLKLWRTASTYDPARGPLDAWVLVVARGLALDTLRRRTQQARLTAKESQITRFEPSGELNPESYVEQQDIIRRVRAATDKLSPPQRSTVILACFEDRSLAQVAALEGVPLGTVKSRKRQAAMKLRHLLSEEQVC
jgi:RNA polymerase sigma-70 factor (ECF subfamily)